MGFQIGIKDIVDIALVAILLFQMFKLLKKTGAINIFIGILAFLIFWFVVSYIFRMELLGGILDRVVSVGAFGLIVLFQDEIRRSFSRIGSSHRWSLLYYLKKLFNTDNDKNERINYDIVQIVHACRNLAKTYTGALIVITRKNDLELYVQSGEQINANINSRLIECVFFKNNPLHDGALIISDRTLKAAACILPISNNQSIPKRMGLRHRAAFGITDNSDAIAIVVSEETGHISWAMGGQLKVDVKPEELEQFLSTHMT